MIWALQDTRFTQIHGNWIFPSLQTSDCHRTTSIWNALSHSSLSPRAIPWASVWGFQNTCGRSIIELVATVNIALVLNTNRFLPKKGLLNPFNVTNAGTKTPLSDFKNHVRSVRGGGGVDCSQCTERGARVIGLWRHMRAIHSLGTLPPESSNYQAAAGRSVLGITFSQWKLIRCGLTVLGGLLT